MTTLDRVKAATAVRALLTRGQLSVNDARVILTALAQAECPTHENLSPAAPWPFASDSPPVMAVYGVVIRGPGLEEIVVNPDDERAQGGRFVYALAEGEK